MHATSRLTVSPSPCPDCVRRSARAASSDARPTIHADVEISGSYVIVENLDFDLAADENNRVTFEGSDHAVLRTSEVHDLDLRRNSTVVIMSDATHTVIYGNHIHDNGGFGAPVQGWGSGKRYFIASNTFTSVGTNIDVDPFSAESSVSEDASAFEDGAAQFEATYGIDVR